MDAATQPSSLLFSKVKRIRHAFPAATSRDPAQHHPDAWPTTSFRPTLKEGDGSIQNSDAYSQPLVTFPLAVPSSSRTTPSTASIGSSSAYSATERPSSCASMSDFDPSASSSSLASQVTLIDEAPLVLKFNRRSASNATLYSGSFPIYKVSTNKDGTKTEVYDVVGNESHIATIKRREFLPDIIKYRNRPAGHDIVRLASWLKYERLEEGM